MIKAGHTGWNMAGIAVQNILSLLPSPSSAPSPSNSSFSFPSSSSAYDSEDDAKSSSTSASSLLPTKLAAYEPSPPQIRVTLGLHHGVSELLPSMVATETEVKRTTYLREEGGGEWGAGRVGEDGG